MPTVFGPVAASSANRFICNIVGFVGTMLGITNTLATCGGFIGPTIVGALTYGNVSAVSLSYICNLKYLIAR